MPKVAVVVGSKSDLPIIKRCIDILEEFEISYELKVLSAHRTPFETQEFAVEAEKYYDLIIAAAGKAAHLPGVIASYTLLPVIGLPIKSSTLDGLDSLLSIVQMPKGIPVATVAIDGAENAALLACHILSLKYPYLRERLAEYRERMAQEVLNSQE
ncbi:5-(carboxyamino)imidazole ribonucleotide mutase [Caldanaerobacter sp.]|uniref:5-(carboxyamino)imidazole ribonucleotide mutase n=1 Tax=Caldanaerobacter sp. TaxID=2930036 RepID=UPI003C78640C